MNPEDPNENPFAPEHAHIHEWVTAAEDRLQQLDQEMRRAGVATQLAPPNPMSGNGEVQVRRSRADIQHDKDETKARTYQQVEKETETAERSLKKETQDIAFGRLYKEEIDKLRAVERGLANPATTWSMNETQIKAMNWLKNNRDRVRAQHQGPNVPQPGREQPNMPEAPQEPEF